MTQSEPKLRFTVSYTTESWSGNILDESFDTDDLAEAMESVFDLIQQGRKVKLVARKKR